MEKGEMFASAHLNLWNKFFFLFMHSASIHCQFTVYTEVELSQQRSPSKSRTSTLFQGGRGPHHSCPEGQMTDGLLDSCHVTSRHVTSRHVDSLVLITKILNPFSHTKSTNSVCGRRQTDPRGDRNFREFFS